MVRSSRVPPPTAVAAASSSSSSAFPSSQPSSTDFHHHTPQGPPGSTADLGKSNNPAPFQRGLPEGWSLPERPHTRQAGESSRTPRGPHRRTSSLVSSNTTTTTTRSSCVDLGRTPAIATATTAVKARPVLHVNPKSVSRTSHSVSSSPLRRNPHPPSTSSSNTTPSSATAVAVSTDSYLYWKQVPALPVTPSLPPVLPDLNLPRPESDDFSKIPGITTSPLLPPYQEESTPRTHAKTEPTPPPPPPRVQPGSSTPSHVRSGSRNRSQSQKAMLGFALEKAHTAVTLDNAGNLEGAMEAYRDACALLSQVMNRTGGDNDRSKLQAIVSTSVDHAFRSWGRGKKKRERRIQGLKSRRDCEC